MRLRLRWGALALGLLVGLAGCASSPTPQARATNTPVLVQSPTSTPIPTPTDPAGQALDHVAIAAVGRAAQAVGVVYDADARNLTITVTITGDVPATDAQVSAAWARVKGLTLREMGQLWGSGQLLDSVTVIVMGPAQDEYDAVFPQAYSVATLSATSAKRIDWASATPDSAWGHYDQTFLRPSFTVADDVITGPVTTASAGE